MRLLVCSFVALLITACGTMPAKKLEKLQSAPSEKIHKTPIEVINLHPPSQELGNAPLKFALDEKDWILNLGAMNVPADNFRMLSRGSATPYLVISGYFHNVAYGKNGAVIGKVFVFNTKGAEVKVPMVQMGEEPNCGLYRCMKIVYKIKDLKPGRYNVVVIPHVVDPDKPFKVNEVSNTAYTPATGALKTKASTPVYADYFGDMQAEFATKLPLDENRKDVVTFK